MKLNCVEWRMLVRCTAAMVSSDVYRLNKGSDNQVWGNQLVCCFKAPNEKQGKIGYRREGKKKQLHYIF